MTPRILSFAFRSSGRTILSVSLAFILQYNSPTASAGEELLVRAKVNGRETTLYEKVVVTSSVATLSDQPGEQGKPIEPFAIFYRLKTDDGKLEINDCVRVGTSDGQPRGWIRTKDVTSWNTRFVLEPLQPIPDRKFTVQLDTGTTAELLTVPEGKRRFALVTQPPKDEKGDDTVFPVVVYAGHVQSDGSGGTIARERNELRDVTLEIVFVVESTDFMLGDYDGLTMGQALKDLIRGCVETFRNDANLRSAVRLGIVEYQDNVATKDFTSRVTCSLTSNPEEIIKSLDSIKPKELKDDWPDDVLAGLHTAATRAGWTENSFKQIILLGASTPHLEKQGLTPSQFGGSFNSYTDLIPSGGAGYNSTGLSIRQLLDLTHPQGGTVADKARRSKTFHTVLFGKQIKALPSDLIQVIDDVVHYNNVQLATFLASLSQKVGQEKAVELTQRCFLYYLIKYQRGLAESRYAEIARNDGIEGLYFKVEPERKAVKDAIAKIAKTVTDSFATFSGVRSGRVGVKELDSQKGNEITQTFYAVVGAAADKFKDQAVLTGTSSVRDQRGREVAQKKVLVAQKELQRLRSTIDALHQTFKTKVAKVDRQNVTDVLDALKNVVASTGAGQFKFSQDIKLKDVISDLPLRTSSLDTTPADIAVMPSDTFTQWLNKLEATVFRIDDLLNGKADWLDLSSVALNDRYTFLRLSELP